MKKIVSIFLIAGGFFVLTALLINSWIIKQEENKGYKMADGRYNPFSKGSAKAANWAKTNPLPDEPKKIVELELEDNDKEKDLGSKD